MKKLLLLFFLCYPLFSVLDNSQSYPSIITLENESPLFQELLDGDDKKTIIYVPILIFIAINLLIFYWHGLIQFIRRLITLCPVYYQSNYVVFPPNFKIKYKEE